MAPAESSERSESSEACRHQGERRGLGHWRWPPNRNLGDPDFAVPVLDPTLQDCIVQSLIQGAAARRRRICRRTLPGRRHRRCSRATTTAIEMVRKKIRTKAANAASPTPAKSALTAPCIADATVEIGIRVATAPAVAAYTAASSVCAAAESARARAAPACPIITAAGAPGAEASSRSSMDEHSEAVGAAGAGLAGVTVLPLVRVLRRPDAACAAAAARR